jgi:signal transduction histidine kinase
VDENGRPVSRRSLLRLLDNLPDGVLLINPEGRVIFANPAAELLFDYQPGSMIGRLLGVPVVEGVTEIEIPHAGGGLCTAEIRAVRVRWEAKELILASLRNVSQRKRAENRVLTLGKQLLEAYETITGRLGKEIHDSIGQPLIGLKLALYRFQELREREPEVSLEEINTRVDEMIDSIRRLSHNLRPAAGDKWSLKDALENHFRRLEIQGELTVHFMNHFSDHELSRVIQTVAFRIIQESLDNVLRHAKAHEADVTVDSNNGDLLIQVDDRGAGFDPSAPVGGGAIGLKTMRERTELAGGTLTVDSAPGRGTRISAVLPLT